MNLDRRIAAAAAVNSALNPPQDKTPSPFSVSSLSPRSVLQTHVYDVYERIAGHFSHTRYKMWPQVHSFIESLPCNSLVLDAGCGNGKNMKIPGFVGTDRAFSFCSLAKTETTNDTFVSDLCQDSGLSLRAGLFDAAVSIAVIHHLPTAATRRNALRQLARPVVAGGHALIYVWAFEQTEGSVGARRFEDQDVLVPWHLNLKLAPNDASISSNKSLERLDRYYHVFTKEEVAELVASVSDYWTLEGDIQYDSNNWGVRLTRTRTVWSREYLENID
jgi:SAM-dependent methyltransferase